MSSISTPYRRGLDLHDLLVLDLLLRERSLTRAAQILDLTQPALSKSLARLRHRFSDPLFVRAGLKMEPTPKALGLQQPVAEIAQKVQNLYDEEIPFDPRTSTREFNFC